MKTYIVPMVFGDKMKTRFIQARDIRINDLVYGMRVLRTLKRGGLVFVQFAGQDVDFQYPDDLFLTVEREEGGE